MKIKKSTTSESREKSIVLIAWWSRSKLRFMIHELLFFFLLFGTVLQLCTQNNEKPSSRFPLCFPFFNCKSNRLPCMKNHNQHTRCTIMACAIWVCFQRFTGRTLITRKWSDSRAYSSQSAYGMDTKMIIFIKSLLLCDW